MDGRRWFGFADGGEGGWVGSVLDSESKTKSGGIRVCGGIKKVGLLLGFEEGEERVVIEE